VTIDGTNAFVLCRHGIFWDGPVGPTSSVNLRFSNIRCEQGQRPGGYAVYLSHYAQNVLLENIHADTTENGFLLRGVRYATLLNCVYAGHGVALDVGSPDNYDVALLNCFFQAGSTTRTVGMREAFSLHRAVSGSPVSPITFFDHGGNANPFVMRNGVREYSRSGRLQAGEQVAVPVPVGGAAVGMARIAVRDAAGGAGAALWALTAGAATRASGSGDAMLRFIAGARGELLLQNVDRAVVTYVLSVDWSVH
jgi:hypothetical protein